MNTQESGNKIVLAPRSFFFIRHGETEHNVKNICAGGTVDSALTERGKDQARSLGLRLPQKEFGAIFSSTLQRAKDTAQLITNRNPETNFNLREWDLGLFEEKPVEQLVFHIQNPEFNGELPGGESKSLFFNRSISTINNILINNQTPLIVAHGGTYWALLDSLGLNNELIDNCECIFFEYSNGIWKRTNI